MTPIDQEIALDWTGKAAKKLGGGRQTQVRSTFFYRAMGSDAAPPATRLLKNRSQDGLQVKLALFYLWAAGSANPDPRTGKAHTVKFHDVDVANVFGLLDPGGNGKRRIANARKRLASKECPLIRLEAGHGGSRRVILNWEDGSGSPYLAPGEPGGGGNYYKLPKQFWTNGWHLCLSGPAIVAHLILQQMQQTGRPSRAWVSPSFRERHFGFSEDTWYRGVNELWSWGIVERTSETIREAFEDEARRRRFTYELNLHRFHQEPAPDPGRILLEDSGHSTSAS